MQIELEAELSGTFTFICICSMHLCFHMHVCLFRVKKKYWFPNNTLHLKMDIDATKTLLIYFCFALLHEFYSENSLMVPCRHPVNARKSSKIAIFSRRCCKFHAVTFACAGLPSTPLTVTASAFHALAPPMLKQHSPRWNVPTMWIWVLPLCARGDLSF